MGGKTDNEAKRAAIMAESMEKANEPRYGFFGYTSPLAIGENSEDLRKQAKRAKGKPTEDDFKKPNMLCPGSKKGSTTDTLFGFTQPISIGDPYKARAGAVKRERMSRVDPEAEFRPAGAVKFGLSKGVEYQMRNEKREVRQKKDEDSFAKPNILTTVTKKGGGGIYTPGVLFGMDEERKFPEYIPQGSDKPKKDEGNEKSAVHEQAFKGPGYGNQTFDGNVEAYHCDQPYGIPRPEKPFDPACVKHEVPFRPLGGIKEGHDAYCGYPTKDPDVFKSFPEWQPDPVPQAARRKQTAEDKEGAREAWKVGAPVVIDTPTPPVQMIRRNLRAEFPKSFMRPKI